jgi:DNA-binding transcriptional regulator YiaG
MAILFKKRLRIWRGRRRQKEAAADLSVPVSTYRKWEYGKRQPSKMAMVGIEQLMSTAPDTTK